MSEGNLEDQDVLEVTTEEGDEGAIQEALDAFIAVHPLVKFDHKGRARAQANLVARMKYGSLYQETVEAIKVLMESEDSDFDEVDRLVNKEANYLTQLMDGIESMVSLFYGISRDESADLDDELRGRLMAHATSELYKKK